jgi:hypothetical protein
MRSVIECVVWVRVRIERSAMKKNRRMNGVTPATYDGLAVGSHNFEARAIDPAVNTDPTPANSSWRIQ